MIGILGLLWPLINEGFSSHAKPESLKDEANDEITEGDLDYLLVTYKYSPGVKDFQGKGQTIEGVDGYRYSIIYMRKVKGSSSKFLFSDATDFNFIRNESTFL